MTSLTSTPEGEVLTRIGKSSIKPERKYNDLFFSLRLAKLISSEEFGNLMTTGLCPAKFIRVGKGNGGEEVDENYRTEGMKANGNTVNGNA